MTDPDGSRLGLEIEKLNHTPFTNYFFPGLLLFVFNGLFNLFASIFSFQKHRFTARLSFLQGSILIAGIILEIHFIGLTHITQAIIFIIGTVEIFISITMIKYNIKNDQKIRT